MPTINIPVKTIQVGPSIYLTIHYQRDVIQNVTLIPSEIKGMQWTFCTKVRHSYLEDCVNHWLEAYSQNQTPSVSLPLDWNRLPLFTRHALQIVEKIPIGTTYTYGQVAHYLGQPKAGRAVGGACRRNPFILFIPCHRVLDAKQKLRGYSAGGITVKQTLLLFENTPFV